MTKKVIAGIAIGVAAVVLIAADAVPCLVQGVATQTALTFVSQGLASQSARYMIADHA